jgi:hypothetical protein
VAFDFAAEQLHMPIRPGKAEHRDEASAALVEFCRASFLNSDLDLVHRHGEIARAVGSLGPVGGVDARIAVQRIDDKSGIVRKGRQAGGLRRGQRLDRGVFLERRAGLVRLDEIEIGRRLGFKAHRPDQVADFADLAGIVAGNDQGLVFKLAHCVFLIQRIGAAVRVSR